MTDLKKDARKAEKERKTEINCGPYGRSPVEEFKAM